MRFVWAIFQNMRLKINTNYGKNYLCFFNSWGHLQIYNLGLGMPNIVSGKVTDGKLHGI